MASYLKRPDGVLLPYDERIKDLFGFEVVEVGAVVEPAPAAPVVPEPEPEAKQSPSASVVIPEIEADPIEIPGPNEEQIPEPKPKSTPEPKARRSPGRPKRES